MRIGSTELAALRSPTDLRRRRVPLARLNAAGYSYREIIEILGVTCSNVNRHMTEARAEVRQL